MGRRARWVSADATIAVDLRAMHDHFIKVHEHNPNSMNLAKSNAASHERIR
jgi:hypothetical protein